MDTSESTANLSDESGSSFDAIHVSPVQSPKDKGNDTAQALSSLDIFPDTSIIDHEASRLIQSHWRGRLARRNYAAAVGSIILIQTMARDHASRKKTRLDRESAICIQRQYRGYGERSRYRSQVRCAVRVQAAVRSHLCRKQRARVSREAVLSLIDRQAFRTKWCASIKIQAMVRSYIAAKHYNDRIRSIVLIQSIIRGYLCWKHVLIKKLYSKSRRCTNLLRQARHQEVSCRSLHQFLRGYAARRQQSASPSSVVVLQSIARVHASRRMAMLRFKSALCIQRYYRGFRERRSYNHKLKSAVVVQTAVRSHLCRQRTFKNAAGMIQSHWKGLVARRHYAAKRNACIKVQAVFRCCLAANNYFDLLWSSILVQSVFRGHICRKRSLLAKPQTESVSNSMRFL